MGLIFVIHEENMLTKMDFEGEEKKPALNKMYK